MRYVVCAALHVGEELILGPRHYDQTMQRQIQTRPDTVLWYDAEQGFIDQYGAFLTREEAWLVAEKADQLRRRVNGDGEKLYSENLY